MEKNTVNVLFKCSFFSCMSHELAQDGVTFARELFNPKI